MGREVEEGPTMADWKKIRAAKAARRGVAAAMALTLGLAPVPFITYEALAAASTDATVQSWDAAFNGSSYIFTIVASGDVTQMNKYLAVSYDDGTQGNNNAIQLTWDCSEVKGGWYQNIEGATVASAGGVVTVSVPASYFGNKPFTVTYCGSSLTSAQMGGASASVPAETPSTGGESGSADTGTGTDSGNAGTGTGSSTGAGEKDDAATDPDAGTGSDSSDSAAGSEAGDSSDNADSSDADNDATDSDASAPYSGIVIDGDFSDWDSVAKVDVDEGKGWSTVDRMAMVWDGDWVYLYFETSSDDYAAVTGAGDWNNGQYAITTDLGNQTLVQLQRGPAVAGIDGAQVAVNNTEWGKAPHKWEVAIPASKLGNYSKTISFGIYQKDPAITGVANLQAFDDDADHTFNGIVYDGKYDDWTYYPHTTIQYATAGTGAHEVDSSGALYADSTTLYGHVQTTMPAHLAEAGGEFTSAVSIKINDDEDLMLTPRFIAVDADGNINWNPQLSGLAEGTYEFYLVSTTCNGNSKNINDLQGDDVVYGRAMITIGAEKDEMEYAIDIDTLANHLHAGWGQAKDDTSIDGNSIKKFSAQYGRLGQEWVSTAGTSTGPVLGLGLCLATVGGTYAHRRRRRD